jgi:hypothetical protein
MARSATALVAALLSVLASASPTVGAADPIDWLRLVRPADGFEVEIPRPITSRPTEVAASVRPLALRATTWQHDGGTFILAVGMQENRRAMALDRIVDASFAGLGCLDTSAPEPIPMSGATARELHGTRCLGADYKALLQQIVRDRLIYQVLAIYRDDHELDARRFVHSFKLIARASPAPARRGR